MSDPTRYRVANNQAQLTLGGGILAVDPAGPLVMYDDYAELRIERIHDLNQIGGLQEENARLLSELADLKSTAYRFKAELERLDTGIKPEGSNDAVGRAVNVLLEKDKENARLKAEVERLTFDPSTYLDDQGEWMPRHIHLAAVERLKAEVERLRKAGDELAGWFLDYHPSAIAWNAAKEGKV